MSDTDYRPELTEEYVRLAMVRDSRFMKIARGDAIKADLRDSAVIKAIMAAIKADSEQAMIELEDLNPGDTLGVSAALIKIRTFFYIKRVLGTILNEADAAEQTIRDEDAQ